MNRWGAGGARIKEVHLSEPNESHGLTVAINYEAAHVERGLFCLGLVDEAGNEMGAAVSQPVLLKEGGGRINCSIEGLGFRSGIYFPVAAILSPDGVVHDRWKLERAIVIERDTDILPEGFGAVEIPSRWSREAPSGSTDLPRLSTAE
jgi:hypothetical protein